MRKCRHCRTEIPPKAKSDFYQSAGYCNNPCMAAHGLEKARQQQQRKADRAAKAGREGKPKKQASQEELTQQVVNKMTRLLDAGKPCISCGRMRCGAFWDAGHKQSVGSTPELRFDPRNIHLQGSGCNRANRRPDKRTRRGVETIAKEYEARLRERYGDELVDWLNGPHPMPHYSDDELKALRAVYAAECRRLERGEGPSRDWRAMDYTLRDLISD